jgi:hypothetical protein
MVNTGKGKDLRFKVVSETNDPVRISSVADIEKMIKIDLYEGYRKIGRLSLSTAKLKMR